MGTVCVLMEVEYYSPMDNNVSLENHESTFIVLYRSCRSTLAREPE